MARVLTQIVTSLHLPLSIQTDASARIMRVLASLS